MDDEWDIIQGDCLSVMKSMPSDSVDMCVTSPPYFNLRAYGDKGDEIGRETTPHEFVDSLRGVFHELRRVLKPTGTLWLNLGDSYNGKKDGDGLPPKSLIGIPWRVAFALQDDGWVLRNDIIWNRVNSMPESAPDRISRTHEYIFLFTRSPSGYFFDNDSIKEPTAWNEGGDEDSCAHDGDMLISVPPDERVSYEAIPEAVKAHYKNLHDAEKGQANHSFHKRRAEGIPDAKYKMRRKRDVWSVPSRGFAEGHFATYPEELIRPCILAGCPKGGIVLDPFNGAGTTGVVALKNRRRYIGIELYPKYVEISRRRIERETAQLTFDF